ncbi:MAG: FHA domain-containing protein [Terriglobia bacterium]
MKRVSPSLLFVVALLGLFSLTPARAATPATLADGAAVQLRLMQTIYGAAATTGQPVQFQVVKDFKIGGDVIIAKGGMAFGAVREARHKGLLHGAELIVDVNSVALADGEKVPLRAQATAEAANGTDPRQIDFSQGTPASLYLKHKGITVLQGIEITAYVDGNQPLDLDKFKKPTSKAPAHPSIGQMPGAMMPQMPATRQAPTAAAPERPPMEQAPRPPAQGAAAAAGPSAAQQAEVSKLMVKALNTNDPAQQVQIYDQILALDPNNLVAYNARKDAAAKLQEQQAAATQQQSQQTQQTQQAETAQAQKRTALAGAQHAYLAGNIPLAMSQLSIARKIDPTDPEVLRLSSLVYSRRRTSRFIKLVLLVVVIVIVILMILLVLLKRGASQPYLEVIDGLDHGQRYRIDKDVIHLGAVAQDGGNKNEVVVRDPERTVSRFHCEIHKQKGKLYLSDCQSANGTYLNGKLIAPGKLLRLKKGSRIRLAEGCTLRIGFEKVKKEEG